MDCRGNSADIFRVWQHAGGIFRRYACHDQRGLRGVRRAGVGLLPPEPTSPVSPDSAHVKVVGTVNFAATFPACRAVVHHGGAGTTAASLRAGVPTLILSTDLDQTLWGVRVKRLKVGAARRFSTTTQESLVDGSPSDPCPRICHPVARIRHPDDETRGKCCGGRRSHGEFRAACWLTGGACRRWDWCGPNLADCPGDIWLIASAL